MDLTVKWRLKKDNGKSSITTVTIVALLFSLLAQWMPSWEKLLLYWNHFTLVASWLHELCYTCMWHNLTRNHEWASFAGWSKQVRNNAWVGSNLPHLTQRQEDMNTGTCMAAYMQYAQGDQYAVIIGTTTASVWRWRGMLTYTQLESYGHHIPLILT